MVRQALVLAAGRGRQIGEAGVPNCLTPVGGQPPQPLIVRWLRVLQRAGIKRVGVVVGWQGATLRKQIEALRAADPSLTSLELLFFENTAWERPNGLSVLAARSFLTERTLLVMADQIVAPRLIDRMVRLPEAGDVSVLAVDRDVSGVFDFQDATKATLQAVNDGATRVTGISKGLSGHQALSTNVLVAAPSLLTALDALPEPSLTEGVNEAARRGLVVAHDVAGALWQDVDSPEMRLHAEWLLRVYGDELARPEVHGAAPSAESDALALIERLLADKDAPRYTLLNPGPVMTSARLKAALVHYDTCHRDGGYSAVVRRLADKLAPVFGASDEHDVLLVTGSGTSAMEMAISSSVPPGKKILTVSNGAFGERLGEIAELHGMQHQRLKYAWGELVKPADVEALLAADPDIAVVAMIHHETSIGLLNPVGAIGRICRKRGPLLIVDAVSSLGAEDVNVVRDQIDICYASSNKCLHSVSGMAFLCVSPRVWPLIASVPPRVYYLDLQRYRRYAQDLEQTPFTPAVSAFFALDTALDELAEQGGVPARRETYRRRNLRIRRVLSDLGFESFTNTGRESLTICTMRAPKGVQVDALYESMKDRGFIIYKCKGPLALDHVQVANMGELPDAEIDAFLSAMTEVVAAAKASAEPAERKLRSV